MSLVDGIYLEEKKSNLGTGSTSSTVVFRNYYAVFFRGETAISFLLDDKLALTGMTEKGQASRFAAGMTHQPDLHEQFAQIKQALAQRAAQAKPAQCQPAAPPVTATPPAQPQPPQSAKSAKQVKPAAPKEASDGNWWDLTSRGADHLLKK